MSNPFTAPTLTGYNSSPPADDGTEVASNALKWSTHVDKIGDPLQTYAAAISANVSTAFGLTFGQTFETKSANYTIAAADRGKVIVVDTDAVTITLLAAASAGTGFPIVILNGTTAGLVTVDGDGSETINGDTSIVLYPGKSLVITCNGSAWYGIHSDSPYEQVQLSPSSLGFTSNTTLADLWSDRPVEAAEWYGFEAELFYTQNGGDIKIQPTFSQTPQSISWRYHAQDETGTTASDVLTATTVQSITTMTDTEEVRLAISGVFQGHASNAGLFTIQGAQNVSDPDTTLPRQGGKLIIRRFD